MTNRTKWYRAAALASVIALTVGACGSSSSAAHDTGGATESTNSGGAAPQANSGINGSVAGSLDTSAPLYGELPADVKAAGKLVVGSQLGSPPVTFLQDDGTTIDGVIPDLAVGISKQIGVPVEFQQVSFASLTPSLQAGKILAAFDMMSDTPTRRETFDFVDFLHNGLTYLIKKGNPDHIGSVSDLCGKSIAGVSGTDLVKYAEQASEKCVADGKGAIDVKQFQKASDARLQVQNGKAVAFLGQTPIMLYLAKTANDGTTFDAVIDESYKLETIGIAIAKKNSDLRDVLQKALQNIVDDGAYKKVLGKYGLEKLALDKITVNEGS